MRILGLDVGDARIGVAVSDELYIAANGLPTIRRKTLDQTLAAIERLVKQYEVGEIVAGMPINMDGTMGASAAKVMEFARLVEERTGVPVRPFDERLSTHAANEALMEAQVPWRKRKGLVDKVAAVIILQGYLDRKGKA